jgi:hypothetical protein
MEALILLFISFIPLGSWSFIASASEKALIRWWASKNGFEIIAMKKTIPTRTAAYQILLGSPKPGSRIEYKVSVQKQAPLVLKDYQIFLSGRAFGANSETQVEAIEIPITTATAAALPIKSH